MCRVGMCIWALSSDLPLCLFPIPNLSCAVPFPLSHVFTQKLMASFIPIQPNSNQMLTFSFTFLPLDPQPSMPLFHALTFQPLLLLTFLTYRNPLRRVLPSLEYLCCTFQFYYLLPFIVIFSPVYLLAFQKIFFYETTIMIVLNSYNQTTVLLLTVPDDFISQIVHNPC